MTTRFQVRFEVAGDGQVKAAIDSVDKGARRLEDAGDRASRGLGRMEGAARAAGAAVGAVLVAGLVGAIRNTAEASAVQAQLEARLNSTKQAAGLTLDQLNNMASGLQRVTAFGDETIGTAQGLLLTFTNIGRDVFPRALETVLDMSVAMEQGLKESAIQLGKALNDPILGVTALTRVGVQFTEQQKDTIRTMVEAGQTADAQRVILAELEKQMGGSARAARETLGGAFTALQEAIGDLLEGDDDSVTGLTSSIEALTTIMQAESTKSAFASFVEDIAGVAAIAATTIGRIYELRAAADIKAAGGALGGAGEGAASARLAQINELLRKIESARGGDIGARVFVDSRSPINSDNLFDFDFGNREAALQAERARIMRELQDRRRQSLQDRLMEGMVIVRGTEPAAPATDPDAERAAEALAKQYASMNERLREQADLFGVTTEAAKVRWALENTELQKLSQPQKDELIRRAETVDALKAEQEAAEDLIAIERVWADVASEQTQREQDRADAIDRGREATARLIEDMEAELAVLGLQGVAREQAIALRYADANATDEQRARIAELAEELANARDAEFAMNTLKSGLADLASAGIRNFDDLGAAAERFGDRMLDMAIDLLADRAIQWLLNAFANMLGGSAPSQSFAQGFGNNTGWLSDGSYGGISMGGAQPMPSLAPAIGAAGAGVSMSFPTQITLPRESGQAADESVLMERFAQRFQKEQEDLAKRVYREEINRDLRDGGTLKRFVQSGGRA